MTVTRRLVVPQNNDVTLKATISQTDSIPTDAVFDITGMQIDFWIKTSKDTADTDPTTVHLSTSGGDIILTDPTNGVCQVSVAKTHLQTAGDLWYRLDVTSAGVLKTAGNGTFTVASQ